MDYLTAKQIMFIHSRLIKETGGSQGIHDLSALLSAVGRPQGSLDNQDLYPDLFAKAAALLDSLIRNHPFVDGNKRAGMTAAALLLRRNGYQLKTSQKELVRITLGVAQSQLAIEEIAAWLEENSTPIK
ncbi:MAG TPA: type II toxin-antitoxin system death-on-curing family toxin [Thermodesulforhabdus norvegica]|uniref:Type II toxin-antitoxin system death-on-curing family toxin n=1 Tax=Thermodesulforhabdus norvegica TaxID=39841 RepID=A0A7C0WTC6_9BACT|nr:type II toxin-antitoxin system death-on-curing family toxin [Thermodesulforhabdus norvegica]